MPESNLPSGTAEDSTLSFDDGVDAIENLIIDPETPDLEKTVEASDDAEQPEGEDGEVETDENAEQQEEPDGPEVGSGGKFVSNDAKVTLNDGTVTTVEALKRGFMSQQSFTRSTQEVAAQRKELDGHKSQLGNIAQSLAQARDFLLSVKERTLPKAPDRELMQSDPFGYMQAKAAYDEEMQVVNQLQYQRQSEAARLKAEQEEAANQRAADEAAKLFEAIPEFRDRKVYEAFWTEATETAEHYGYSPTEFAELATDHRIYKAMRDLVKYRKALKAAPKVKQEIQAKPKMIQGGKRMDPKAKTSREAQGRSEALRKSGDFDAGVRALMDLNL